MTGALRNSSIFTGLLAPDLTQLLQAVLKKYPNLKVLEWNWFWRDFIEPIRYVDPQALNDFLFEIWLEPEDWKPLWLPTSRDGPPKLANPPHHRLSLQGGLLPPRRPDQLFSQSSGAKYAPDDKEHLSFIRTVWYQIRKQSTVKLIRVGLDGAALSPPFRSTIHLGKEAVRWLGADPARRMDERYRPAPEAYLEMGLPIPDDPAIEAALKLKAASDHPSD